MRRLPGVRVARYRVESHSAIALRRRLSRTLPPRPASGTNRPFDALPLPRHGLPPASSLRWGLPTRSPREADTSGGADTGEEAPMSTPDSPSARRRVSGSSHIRSESIERGIKPRTLADGRTVYDVANGKKGYVTINTLREARAFRREIEARELRGEHLVLPKSLRFRDAAGPWYEVAQHELRPGVAKEYK